MTHITRRSLLQTLAGAAGLTLLSACGGAAAGAHGRHPPSRPRRQASGSRKPGRCRAGRCQPASTQPAAAASPAAGAEPSRGGSRPSRRLGDWLAGEDRPLEFVRSRVGKAQQDLVDRFNASQKDVVVENQFQGSYKETGQKLTAALQAKQAPDVSILSDVWWFKFYLNKATIAVDDMLKANNVDKSDYVDAFVNEGSARTS